MKDNIITSLWVLAYILVIPVVTVLGIVALAAVMLAIFSPIILIVWLVIGALA